VIEPTPLRLRINGRVRNVFAAVGDTLLTVLREGLQLTGAKRGCNQGVCGACTVLIDGRPMRSCLSLAHNCIDREITTIEGAEEIAAKLQNAFAQSGAVQCGFCTPAMVLTATALLRDNAKPTTEEIRIGLSGNLCRCSGYRKIIDAVRLAAGEPVP
jgi:aerobic-type carbon monoxide dehydrogenase small subunit (CoxS/CutS family)